MPPQVELRAGLRDVDLAGVAEPGGSLTTLFIVMIPM